MRIGKRAILMPEVLKIIIAVLCLILLFYLAFNIYQIFTAKSELEQARATLDAISGKINTLKEGNTTEYLITSPKGWRVIPYDKSICICAKSEKAEEQVDKCKVEGVCKEFNYTIKLTGTSVVCVSPAGFTGKEEDLENCFSLNTVPRKAYINLKNSTIYLSSSESISGLKWYLFLGNNAGKAEWKEINLDLRKNEYGTFTLDFSPYLVFNDYTFSLVKESDSKGGPYFYLKKDQEIEIWFLFNSLMEFRVGSIDSEGYVWLTLDFLNAYCSISKEIHYFLGNENQKEVDTRPSPLEVGAGDYQKSYKTNIFVDLKVMNSLLI